MDNTDATRMLRMVWQDSSPDNGFPGGMPGYGSREEIFIRRCRRAAFSEEQIQAFLNSQKAAGRH
jgi:hypothetical protein